MNKSKPKIVFTSILNHFEKKRLSILIPKVKVSTFAIKEVNINIINVDAYYITFKLKKARFFALSIKHFKYQVAKKARFKINSKSLILEKYHEFLNVFFKNNLDTPPFHQKYNYKIILKEKQKYSYITIYKML